MSTQESNSEAWYFTWSRFITREDVQRITRKATRWQKFKLLFRRSRYCFDKGAVIRYKKMGDAIYIMRKGTRL